MPSSESRTLRSRLGGGDVLVGAFITLVDPAAVEIAGRAGFDFVFLEFEHGLRDQGQLLALVRAADAVGIRALVRIGSPTPNLVGRCLDSGLAGIVLPQVRSADDVRRVVRWAQFPPDGERGAGGQRGYLAAQMATSPDAFEVANAELLIIAIIEVPEAVAAIEDILDVPGLTGVMPGPGDLALSLGRLRQDDPTVLSSLAQVAAATQRRKNRVLMEFCPNPNQVQPALERGAQMLLLGPDQALLANSFGTLLAAARAIATHRAAAA